MTKRLQKLLCLAGLYCMAFLFPQISQAQNYCTIQSSYGCAGWYIYQFSTSGGTTNITNNSYGCSGSSTYSYHTATSHTGLLNSTVGFYLYSGYYSYCNIFVDWNNNGSFTDPGENVYNGNYMYYWQASFSIPVTATIGTVRMRVRTSWNPNPVPCGTVSEYGETEDYNINVTSPCASATGISATAYSKSAVINWSAASGSVSYDVIVNQNANPGTGTAIVAGNVTGTSFTATGLTPSTTYWAHVRNKCSAYPSAWTSYQFTTSSCAPPVANFANITHNSALVLWSSVNVANKYEYLLSNDPTPPGSGATLSTTTTSTIQLNNLDPVTTYYLHIRSVCGSTTSEWDMASFTTMSECMSPSVDIIKTAPNEVEINWQPAENAVAYEYAINSSETPPALGTTVYGASVNFPLPNDKKPYYFHIRSKCVSIFNTSDWKTEQLREGDPTAISNVNDGLLIQAYPNPVNDIVTVQIDGVAQVSGTISVADITGKIVFTTNATDAKTNINMGGLGAGAYFIKYTDGNNTQTFRVNKL